MARPKRIGKNEADFIKNLRALSGMPIKEALRRSEPEHYSENLRDGSTCICGQHLKNAYTMHIKGTNKRYPAGECCYRNHFGTPKIIERERKKRKRQLEDLVSKPMSKGLSDRLDKMGLDSEIFREICHLMKGKRFSEESLLYEMDPGKNKSFTNWFREGIRAGEITDPAVVGLYRDFERDPRLASKKFEYLAACSFATRTFDSEIVIGGVRDDLRYLSKLPKGHHLGGKFSEFNFTAPYKFPHTRFGNNKDDKGKTLGEKLDEDHMTFLDGALIRRQLPGIGVLRTDANRAVANKYGVGRSWDYILSRVRPIFDEVKRNLHEEFKLLGEIIGEHALTKPEYLEVKKFFKKSGMGRRSGRESYLKMFSIREFEETAPRIVAIDRKLKLGNCGQIPECMLKEDFLERYEKLTGLNGDPEKLIRMLSDDDIILLNNKNLINFQKDHGMLIGKMYDLGLIPKKYVKDALRKYNGLLEREGVEELSEDRGRKLDMIRKYLGSPLIKYNPRMKGKKSDGGAWIYSASKFSTKEGRKHIDFIAADIERMKKETGFDISRQEEYKKMIGEIKGMEGVRYLKRGPGTMFAELGVVSFWGFEGRWGDIGTYRFNYLGDATMRARNLVEVDDKFYEKLTKISMNSRKLGVDSINSWYMDPKQRNQPGVRILVDKDLKEKVDRVYAGLR